MTAAAPDRFEDRPEFLLAGVRRSFPVADAPKEIGAVWEALTALGELPGQTGDAAYGVWCAMDMAKGVGEYMAAAEVTGFESLTADTGRMIVPAAQYAVFPHDGHVSTMGAVWQAAFAEWLPNSDYTDGGTPPFERYGPGFSAETMTGDMEIWIPVTAKS
ncbi:MAG: GyrI-like domain-containing protein [Pseudomonadota bacterium]